MGQVSLIGKAAGAGVSGVVAGCVAVACVVATADDSCVKFKFPGSVVLEFKLDAVEFKFAVEITAFIVVEGGAARRRRTSRQVALTRRCVSRRLKQRPHLVHFPRAVGIAGSFACLGRTKQ